MEVCNVSITQGGRTTMLLDEKVTLETNLTSGDRTTTSVALLSIPADGLKPGIIRTAGNAAVFNAARPLKVAFAEGKKKLKVKSNSGLWVVAQTKIQDVTFVEYFRFLFGVVGQSEDVDDSGKKQRPHIDVYPDGNGKFIRLDGLNCDIESNMQYCAGLRQVLPQKLLIKAIDFDETIEVVFSTEDPNEVILQEIRFTN